LISWGVDTIFGLTGDGIDSEFAALPKLQRKLKLVEDAK
jgi:thiamine pyrophosphate-dependent acetolactate synthase large subunit-like protein